MITFSRYVGVAPGTTTFSPNGRRGGLGQPTPGAVYPTQSVWEPDPNSDTVRIAMPNNQWVTGPSQMIIKVPRHQREMGPVPTDLQVAQQGRPWLPVHRGWIDTSGEPIFHLQGAPVGQSADDTAVKWSIAASVISAVALATTTIITVMRFKKGR
jgi:hypothetical protein